MIRALQLLSESAGRALPRELVAAAARIGQSAWPEIVERWSVLTPTGYPVELTVATGDPVLRWTAEIAGPELADVRRLGAVAAYMAGADQAIEPEVLDRLARIQRGGDLSYGAWLGGRSDGGSPVRLKLYAELPAGTRIDNVPMPAVLRKALGRAGHCVAPRMLGVEPAQRRYEIYVRAPARGGHSVGGTATAAREGGGTGLGNRELAGALRPIMMAADWPDGLAVLDHGLPDGLRRLAGRRIGASLASGGDAELEVALFVSARTLFPGAMERLAEIVPGLPPEPGRLHREARTCPTVVTLGLDRQSRRVRFRAGLTVNCGEKHAAIRPVPAGLD